MSYGKTSYRKYKPWTEEWGKTNIVEAKPKKNTNEAANVDLRLYDFFPYYSGQDFVTMDDLPPFSCHLEDLVVGQLVRLILKNELKQTIAHKYWPNIFDSEGALYRARRPMGRPALLRADDESEDDDLRIAQVSGGKTAVLLCGSSTGYASDVNLKQHSKSWIVKLTNTADRDIGPSEYHAVEGDAEDDGGILKTLSENRLLKNRRGYIYQDDKTPSSKLFKYDDVSVKLVENTTTPTKPKQDPTVVRKRTLTSASPLATTKKQKTAQSALTELIDDDLDEPRLSEDHEVMMKLINDQRVGEKVTCQLLANSAAFAKGMVDVNQALLKDLYNQPGANKSALRKASSAIQQYCRSFTDAQARTAMLPLLHSKYDAKGTATYHASKKHTVRTEDGNFVANLPHLARSEEPTLVYRKEPAHYETTPALRETTMFKEIITEHMRESLNEVDEEHPPSDGDGHTVRQPESSKASQSNSSSRRKVDARPAGSQTASRSTSRQAPAQTEGSGGRPTRRSAQHGSYRETDLRRTSG